MGNEGVNAVEKALSLLDCFKPGEESLSLTALSQLSGYHKTTVYRLMNSLERMGYVVRSDSGVTRSARVCYTSASFMSNHSIWPAWCSRNCRRWQRRPTSASWYVLDNGQRLCLFRAESSDGLRHTRLPGQFFRSITPPSVRCCVSGA